MPAKSEAGETQVMNATEAATVRNLPTTGCIPSDITNKPTIHNSADGFCIWSVPYEC
jgi:hypothetical protein